MKHISLILLFLLSIEISNGQVTDITPGINSLPNISTTSTTNGLVFPRMTTLQKESISNVIAGTMIYDTELNCISLYTGNGWNCLNTPNPSNNGLSFQDFQLTMNPSGNCPLCGVISISANQPVKLSYKVKGQDGTDFSFTNEKFSVDNDTTINLFGLYPNYTNDVTVSITSLSGQVTQKVIYIKTDPLPLGLPQPNDISVNVHNPNILTKFILSFPVQTQGAFNGVSGFPLVLDTYGKVRWFITIPLTSNTIMIPLKNSHWLMTFDNSFKEIDLLGNVIRDIPLSFSYHHDVAQLPNGNLMYLGNSSLNNTIEDKVYTLNFNTGSVIDSLNLYTILLPSRPQLPVGPANDWFHSNSLTYDSRDNTIIISGRQQSAVVKIDLVSKQLKWILSDPAYWDANLTPFLLTPNGIFEYSYGQHSAIINTSDSHKILLWDDGNSRSYTAPISPSLSYSRVVEYSVNEQNKTIVQNFEFGKSYGAELFSPYVGSVSYLNNERIFISDGGILKDINNNAVDLIPNAINQIRLFEVDKYQNVYFDISIKKTNVSNPSLIGFRTYRSYPFNFK